MCGIAGMIRSDRDALLPVLHRMVNALRHRGPDGDGIQVVPMAQQWLGLAHTRLAILDLSALASQPMVHPWTGDVLVFNGEIFNYRELKRELASSGVEFKGTGDAEVLLKGLVEYGEAFIPRLRGMFAFAFYQAGKGRLLLARDPLGIKPLYVRHEGPHFAFASEVCALKGNDVDPGGIDREALRQYLQFGAVQAPGTLVKGVSFFPPGHWQSLTIAADGMIKAANPVPFWCYPEPEPCRDVRHMIPALREAVQDAVTSHLVSDVPVGVFLSSGLDSTLVATLAARAKSDIRSFTVGFDDPLLPGEHREAELVARRLGIQHQTCLLSGADVESAMDGWLDHADLPSVDGLNVFLVSRAVRRAGIVVALSGQGGDEMFGGYPSFQDIQRLARWMRMTGWMPSDWRRAFVNRLPVRDTVRRMKLVDMVSGGMSIPELYFRRRQLLTTGQLSALGFQGTVFPEDFSHSITPDQTGDGWVGDPVAHVGALETRYYLGNMLLRDTDACGMAHGLEIRVPLLDTPLIDRVARLPGPLRLPHGKADKYLLRKAFPEVFTAVQRSAPKKGFFLPLATWMQGAQRDRCEAHLDDLKQTGWVLPSGVDAIWWEFLGHACLSTAYRAWSLVALGAWARQN